MINVTRTLPSKAAGLTLSSYFLVLSAAVAIRKVSVTSTLTVLQSCQMSVFSLRAVSG